MGIATRHAGRATAVAWMGWVLLLSACDDARNPASEEPPLTSLTGTVLEIRDSIPVDGGAAVALRLFDDSRVEAYLPSLNTYPQPDSQTLEIHDRVYPVILGLEVGDTVTARGELQENGSLRLWELRKSAF